MIIFNPYDSNLSYESPVESTIWFQWKWIIGNFKDEAGGMNEIEGNILGCV